MERPPRFACLGNRFGCFLQRHRRAALILCATIAGVVTIDRLAPPPLPDASRHAVVVLARDDTPLRAFPDRAHVWRHPITLEQASPRYLDALIGYEDKYFWWHPGVNPLALARAALQWITSGRIVSGGSTLTMQVARLREPMPRTLGGKIKQCLRALQLEARHSKREILGIYLNYAPMGGVLEGVEAASRAYLGKPASRLTHAEAALLAVLPQAPSAFRPDRHPEAARAARDKVLQRLAARWGHDVVADAMKEGAYAPLVRQPLLAPLLAERVRRDRPARTHIQTTIDPGIQSALELLLLDRSSQLPPRVSMAALVIDNATLEVLGYAGSADFRDPGRFSHVDMVRASRSPGSALKPFVYGFALDEGLIHSESLLADAPKSFDGYQPGNFQQSFHGPVSVSEALVRSLNVPAVDVLDRLGAVRFVSLLRRGGLPLQFARDATPNLSVVLGGAGVSLEDLTAAYTAFARRGIAGHPRLYRDDPLRETRMMSEGAAFIVRDMLESGSPVDAAVNASAAASRRIAWKTGTSFGFRDAWAVGVTDRHTVGVWVGRPDGTPNPGHFGANIAAPLLVDVFSVLPNPLGAQTREVPASVTQASICWPLGTRPAADGTEATCHVRRTAWLLNDTAPPTFPDELRTGEPRYVFHVSGDDGLRVAPECSGPRMRTVESARWPTLLEPWLDRSLRDRALPPPWSPACRMHAHAESAVKIVGVTDGAVLHRADGHPPLVRFEARGHRGPLHWMINGALRGRTLPGESYVHRFADPGRYEVTAFDDHGRYERIVLSVR